MSSSEARACWGSATLVHCFHAQQAMDLESYIDDLEALLYKV